jgi:hypothetical protein
MKKARLNVVGAKSPENRSVSTALRISCASANRCAGSLASDFLRISRMGLGRDSSSEVGLSSVASAIR